PMAGRRTPEPGVYETTRETPVYENPSSTSRVISQISRGTRINVVSSSGNWLEVRSKHGNPPGYVRSDDARLIGERTDKPAGGRAARASGSLNGSNPNKGNNQALICIRPFILQSRRRSEQRRKYTPAIPSLRRWNERSKSFGYRSGFFQLRRNTQYSGTSPMNALRKRTKALCGAEMAKSRLMPDPRASPVGCLGNVLQPTYGNNFFLHLQRDP